MIYAIHTGRPNVKSSPALMQMMMAMFMMGLSATTGSVLLAARSTANLLASVMQGHGLRPQVNEVQVTAPLLDSNSTNQDCAPGGDPEVKGSLSHYQLPNPPPTNPQALCLNYFMHS